MPNESTKILEVTELTSQRARLPNRRRTPGIFCLMTWIFQSLPKAVSRA